LETNGICSDSSNVIVGFYERPVATVSGGGDVCDLSFLLEAIPGVGTGEWSKISGPGNASFESGTGSAVTNVVVDEYGQYTFQWTVRNTGCSDSVAVIVNFFNELTVDAGTGGDVCGLETGMKATPARWPGYWEKLNGPGKVTFSPADTAGAVNITVDEYGTYTFQWYESLNDCFGRDTVIIHFHKQPEADAGPDQVLENVFSTFLDAVIPETGTGSWAVLRGGGQVMGINDPGSEVNGLSLGENEFKWTVTTDFCGEAWDKVIITVSNISLPTVITPNNDGYNDFLVFPGVEDLAGSEIVIYTRWGTKIYDNKNYQNDWEGRDYNNREMPPDTYFYVLKLPDGRIVKGFVEIRK
jgi:gliding motility-associated-like protein